jgi:hypothetical protein
MAGMKSSILALVLFLALVFLAGCAAQAQQPAPQATPEQNARSEVAAAFMTGAAPGVLSGKVALGPALQARLGVPPGADSAKIYDALIGLTQGATPRIADATAEEATRSPEQSRPLFTLSAGDLKLLLHYDLQASKVDFVEQLSGPPIAAPAPVAEAAKPEPAQPVYSVVEPRTPHKAALKPQLAAATQPRAPGEPPLKASGPCVIKPVMSDQDLVNCGATPPRY